MCARAEEPKSSRVRLSHSGRYGVRLVELGEGKCRLEVLKEDAPHWTLERCVGTADDLYFASDDGEKVWVLYTLPKKPVRRPSRKAKRAAWTYAVVAARYGRDGEADRRLVLNQLMRTRESLEDVRQYEKHFKWLEGVAGVRGIPPKLNEQGKVELVTLDHKTHTLEF
ncbi:MAG: hypothetical protein IRZ16_04660 [Myxococcaceae bacterium]|nr:hypothetical protein [Myxococcaceae bacterium]